MPPRAKTSASSINTTKPRYALQTALLRSTITTTISAVAGKIFLTCTEGFIPDTRLKRQIHFYVPEIRTLNRGSYHCYPGYGARPGGDLMDKKHDRCHRLCRHTVQHTISAIQRLRCVRERHLHTRLRHRSMGYESQHTRQYELRVQDNP